MTPPTAEVIVKTPPPPAVTITPAQPAAPETPTIPVVEPATIKRSPPVVPAPERPLYTTEVTFTPPRPGTTGPVPPGGNAIIGTESPEVHQDPVPSPYTVKEGAGYEAVKAKKKTRSPVTRRPMTRGRR